MNSVEVICACNLGHIYLFYLNQLTKVRLSIVIQMSHANGKWRVLLRGIILTERLHKVPTVILKHSYAMKVCKGKEKFIAILHWKKLQGAISEEALEREKTQTAKFHDGRLSPKLRLSVFVCNLKDFFII